MKNTNLEHLGGKAAGFLATAGLIALTVISACKKDSNTTSTSATVTEADAAELTTDAVTPSTGGFDAQVSTSVSIYTTASVTMSCGDKKDTTISYSSPTSVVPYYAYSLGWNYQLNCDGAVPNSFVFGFTGSSSYTGALMQSADNSTGSLTLTGLQLTSSNYTLNTSYERSGKQTSKVGNQKTFTSDYKMTSTNILISKSSQQIVSGTATVTITGMSSTGSSFSFGGTITFLGNKKATLVLNSGTVYNIQWT
jgi:hypothetical protein